MSKQLKGQALDKAYTALISIELGGHIHTSRVGNKIEIRASGLPMHPQHPQYRESGWELLDRKTVAHAREYVANRGCMGQWHAYSVKGQL